MLKWVGNKLDFLRVLYGTHERLLESNIQEVFQVRLEVIAHEWVCAIRGGIDIRRVQRFFVVGHRSKLFY